MKKLTLRLFKKNYCMKLISSLLAAGIIGMSFCGAVLAEEIQTVDTQQEQTYQTDYDNNDGEFISDYVTKIIEYLDIYTRDGISQGSLYKAGLQEVLKQHPELYEEVMNALLSSIDENSVFYKSGEFEQFISQLEGAVAGIGITFYEDGNTLIVGTVYEDSPAAKAGVKSGDILDSVDGVSLEGVPIDAAQGLIRGEVGSTVVIGVRRDETDADVLYFTITREEIMVKQSVAYKIFPANNLDGIASDSNENENEDIMYIKIYAFMDNTGEQFGKAMEEADAKNINNIIIDMRDNGGGYVAQAVNVANYFVPKGNVIVTEDHKIDLFDTTFVSENERTQKNDVVVLVNENSASASEIVTAAIKENGVGVVIGTTTFGKGTVQNSSPLKDGEVMKFTVAYYLTPSGTNIDHVGIAPDAYVENSFIPFDATGYSDFTYTSTYQLGDTASDISKAKKIFEVWGAYSGDVDNDYFDQELSSAVTAFQASEGLFPYGVLDITTQSALYKALGETKIVVDEQIEAAFNHYGQTFVSN